MNEMPSQHDLDIITSAIQEYPNETISGAVLGTLIRNVAPNLDIRKAVNLPSGTGVGMDPACTPKDFVRPEGITVAGLPAVTSVAYAGGLFFSLPLRTLP